MACPPGYHETKLSTLFGSVSTPSTQEVICAPDTDNGCSGLFDCAVNAYSKVQLDDILEATAQSVATVASFYATSGLSVVPQIVSMVGAAEKNPDLLEAGKYLGYANKAYNLGLAWEDTMSFFDDFSFDSIVDYSWDIFDDVSWQDVGQFGLGLANTFVSSQNQQVQAIPAMSKVPQIAGAVGSAAGAIARVGPTVGRSFFNKWPNLATGIQKLRNAGKNISRSKLYSMVKRFGPEFLVSAGILTAAAVSELILAGPGHRRMNPANSKALRRATRRIKSFHRLCGDADIIKTRRRSCAKKC